MSTIPGIVLNEDDSHYYFARAGQTLDKETVASFVDQYADTQVDRLVFNPNCMRTSYGSKVWDPIWLNYDPDGPDDQPLFQSSTLEDAHRARGWVHTAWKLDQDGIDPYALWIDRARQHGISPWISMRMNDIHNVDDEKSFIHSEFWRNNPQLRRITYGFCEWQDKALDYGQTEVREHHLALIREFAQKWDMDGLELDWMRFGFHFRPGHEQEGCEILTEFTRTVRCILNEAEKRVGHSIKLSARVPSRPQTSIGLGMDAVRWAKEGLIDSLVVTPFWATAETDMPIELWKSLLEGTGVELAAGLEILLRPYPAYPAYHSNSLETARGMSASFIDRGCDKIYLFNYMDSETTLDAPEFYKTLLREIGSLDTIADKPRRHVITYSDTWAVGQPKAYALPAQVPAGARQAFRINIGPKPQVGEAEIVIGLLEGSDDIEVRCNGELCCAMGEVEMPMPAPDCATYVYNAKNKAVNHGNNTIELQSKNDICISWVEIRIK